MTTTATKTHTFVRFADPYLRCGRCAQPVKGYHDEQQCGTVEHPCPVNWYLYPCGHQADARSSCPSWGPVDGCRCQQVFGRVEH